MRTQQQPKTVRDAVDQFIIEALGLTPSGVREIRFEDDRVVIEKSDWVSVGGRTYRTAPVTVTRDMNEVLK
ncbi:hypothetical protein ACWEOW_11190 [Monashia sp. NPDC004114]